MNKATIYLIIMAVILFLGIETVFGYPNQVCYPLNKTTVCLGQNATGFKINQSDILNPLGGVNYDNGTGISLIGTTFSLKLGFRLPQSCSDGQLVYWNNSNSDWRCINYVSGGGTNTTNNISNNFTISLTNNSVMCAGSDKLQSIGINSTGFLNYTCGTDLNSGGAADGNNNVTALIFYNGSNTILSLRQNSGIEINASFNNTDTNDWNLTYLYVNLANMSYALGIYNNLSLKANLSQGYYLGSNQTYNDTLGYLGNDTLKVNLSDIRYLKNNTPNVWNVTVKNSTQYIYDNGTILVHKNSTGNITDATLSCTNISGAVSNLCTLTSSGGGTGMVFNQNLNTSANVTFNKVNTTLLNMSSSYQVNSGIELTLEHAGEGEDWGQIILGYSGYSYIILNPSLQSLFFYGIKSSDWTNVSITSSQITDIQSFNNTLAVLGNASIKVNISQGVYLGSNQTYNDTLAVLGNASLKVNLTQLPGYYQTSNQTYNDTLGYLGNDTLKFNNTGGKMSGNINMSNTYNMTNTNCIIFKSGGKICDAP